MKKFSICTAFVEVSLVLSKIISFDLQMQIETIFTALFSMYIRF